MPGQAARERGWVGRFSAERGRPAEPRGAAGKRRDLEPIAEEMQVGFPEVLEHGNRRARAVCRSDGPFASPRELSRMGPAPARPPHEVPQTERLAGGGMP